MIKPVHKQIKIRKTIDKPRPIREHHPNKPTPSVISPIVPWSNFAEILLNKSAGFGARGTQILPKTGYES